METPTETKDIAYFTNYLLETRTQFNNDEATDPKTNNLIVLNKNFKENFPMLERVSSIFKDKLSGVQVSPLRSLLSDGVFHSSIISGSKNIQLIAEDVTIKVLILDEIHNQTNNRQIIQNIINSSESSAKKAKAIFCLFYTKVYEKQNGLSQTGGMYSLRARQSEREVVELERAQLYLNNIAPDQKAADIIKNNGLLNMIFVKEEINNKLRLRITNLQKSWDDYKFDDNKYTYLTNIIFEMIVESLSQSDPLKIQITLFITKYINTTPAEYIFGNPDYKFNITDIINNLIDKLINKRYLLKQQYLLPTLTGIKKQKIISSNTTYIENETSESESSDNQYEPPNLNLVSNYLIKKYILEIFDINVFEISLDCFIPGIPSDICNESNDNSTLFPKTSTNCFTHCNAMRVSPWIKHNNHYFLVCMCCGLPMLPDDLNIDNETPITDDKFDKFSDKNISIFKDKPKRADELKSYAGKTQCDHILPLAMMFFTLDKKCSIPNFENIGIGTNFCPIHSSCNTKKSNIVPSEFWEKNNDIKDNDYNWNSKWGIDSFPNGPWFVPYMPQTTLKNINSWCEINKWNPKKYARLLQWKYLSALELLVSKENIGTIPEKEKKIDTLINIAEGIYRGMGNIKEHFKTIIELYRGPIDTNILNRLFTLISIPDAAAAATLIKMASDRGINYENLNFYEEQIKNLKAQFSEKSAVSAETAIKERDLLLDISREQAAEDIKVVQLARQESSRRHQEERKRQREQLEKILKSSTSDIKEELEKFLSSTGGKKTLSKKPKRKISLKKKNYKKKKTIKYKFRKLKKSIKNKKYYNYLFGNNYT